MFAGFTELETLTGAIPCVLIFSERRETESLVIVSDIALSIYDRLATVV
jgi:hypothetical protein